MTTVQRAAPAVQRAGCKVQRGSTGRAGPLHPEPCTLPEQPESKWPT
jgi:hypothetical protein